MVLLAGCIIICAAHCTYPLSWIKRSIDKMLSILYAAMLTKQINSCNFAYAGYIRHPPSGYNAKHFANLLNNKLFGTQAMATITTVNEDDGTSCLCAIVCEYERVCVV